MKVIGSIIVAMMIASSCLAAEELLNDNVTHVIIPENEHLVVFQWMQDSEGYGRIEACYGETIVMFAKRTSDIFPDSDEPYATFNKLYPIYDVNFTAKWYYGFYVKDATNEGPNGINGALDIVVSTEEGTLKDMVPETPGNVVSMTIAMNSGTATLTWESTGVDKTKIYRKDYKASQYSSDTCFPPQSYYLTGCSAKLWMTLDEEATAGVKMTHTDEKWTGLVVVSGINKDTVTLTAVTTEKDAPNSFVRAYDMAALGAASTTVISVIALALLFLSVLII